MKVKALNGVKSGRTDLNQNSLVLLIVHGEVQILLMGDVDVEVETALIKHGTDIKAKLLKIGHHGAASGTSNALLQAVNPDYTVISINADNIRGYPSTEVLQRIADQGITLLTTTLEGDISFESDGRQLRRVQ